MARCRVAAAHDIVLNSECAYTFHSPYTSDQGIVVNLETFIGTVQELALSKSENDEGLFVRICKKRVEKKGPEIGDNPEPTPTRLGIGVNGGFQADDDAFEIIASYSVVVLKADASGTVHVVGEDPYETGIKSSFPEAVVKSVESIIHHSGMAVQQDLKVWELDDEPKPISKYCDDLPFIDNGVKISAQSSDWKCQMSGDTENIWLNLSDGYIGGGRKNWDGSGGSNGALDHFEATGEKYPLVVKLGTITVDIETADCYSYAKDEDGPVRIPNLTALLEKRGIMVGSLQKTAKSTAELEVELNATYAFDAITESGANLVPLSGAGLQGLQNLGNSCYMASVIQLLLSGTVPELARRYGTTANGSVTDHMLLRSVTPKEATEDLLAQTTKLSCALTSGVFAGPLPYSATMNDIKVNDPKYCVQPRMFKHVVAGDHVDFRTGQQQDAAQFFQYMLEKLDRAERAAVSSKRLYQEQEDMHVSSNLFSFQTMCRLECSRDSRIKYKKSATETMLSMPIPMEKAVFIENKDTPDHKRHKVEEKHDVEKGVPTISFQTCLESWAADATVENYRWPHLQNATVTAISQTRFVNFPRYLTVYIQRYKLGADWTPQKLEVNLDVPKEVNFAPFKSRGPQIGEENVPEENEKPTSNEDISRMPHVDEAALAQLMDMGFSFNGCKRALIAVGGSNTIDAMNWVFEHSLDPDFDEPILEADVSGDSGVDEGVVMSLVENLGCFTMDQVRAALKETSGAADRAADWLFSHMDDLDGAIAAINRNEVAAVASSHTALPLEDGDGEYILVGMVSHIGKHTGSGHYVAHLKRGDKWVIFNDAKVALSESPPFSHAYIYLFQRKDSFGSPNPNF